MAPQSDHGPTAHKAFAAYAAQPQQVVTRTRAAASNLYKNVGPGTSVREDFSRSDYEWFRPDSVIPTNPKDVLAACMEARDQFGLVRNITDLMADFSVKGIDIVHPTARGQRIATEWRKRVNLPAVAQQIAEHLSVGGFAPVSRTLMKLPDATLATVKQWGPASAGELPAGHIPLGYTIRDPRTIEIIGGDEAAITGGAVTYAVRVPPNLQRRAQTPGALNLKFVQSLPSGWNTRLAAGDPIPLDPKRFVPVFYRKADYEAWPRPILGPVLRDLQRLNKLQLADLAALDGATSYVRLWRLGDLDKEIYPTAEVISRLSDLLLANTGGGGKDLIWGPELDFKETSADLSKFLGPEKYVSTLNAIYQGLGIPPALTGVGETGTNAFVTLKVLTERLEYLRVVLAAFVEGELALLQEFFGLREPFTVVFDYPNLTDESAEKRLLLDLVDRGLVSAEFVQDRVKAVPSVERVRLKREAKLRDAGKLPDERGPYVQQDPAGDPPGGRPVGRKDKQPRKKRGPKPVTAPPSASLAVALAEVTAAQIALDDILKPAFLASKECKNARQLTAEQSAQYERVAFAVLCTLPPGGEPTAETVDAALLKAAVPEGVEAAYQAARAALVSSAGKPPTLARDRALRAAALAPLWCSPQVNPQEPQ